jgi:DNA-binding transcriptional MerR regulator
LIIPELPEKKFFSIGEIGDLLNIKPHILRYWEQEFPFLLRPRKTLKGHRLYMRKDIMSVGRIYDLLYIEKYTIDGARKKLLAEQRSSMPVTEKNLYYKKLLKIKQELRDILNSL